MMLINSPILRVARITLQTTSPLSIASGARDGFFDVTLVKDALGLPAIPGTSLAGVLRQAFAARSSREAVEAIFGTGGSDSRISRLFVTWGRIHDAGDKPVDGLPFHRSFDADAILGPLLALEPPHRDHVRISHKGAPSNRGKFDRSFVPAGHRFTFTLTLHDDAGGSNESAWDSLLDCLRSPCFRLGGATRRGYGACKVQRIRCGTFDLSSEEGWENYRKTSPSLDNDCGLETVNLPETDVLPLKFELTAEDYWRIGGIQGPARTGHTKVADALIYQEQRVTWKKGKGRLSTPRLVVPASSIKGALSHRIPFHYNRLTGVFADTLQPEEIAAHVEDRNKAVRALFGYVEKEKGRAGALVIEDGTVSGHDAAGQTGYLMHNSIDRFTGGVRDHVLFSEEALYQGKLSFGLYLDTARLDKNLEAEQLKEQTNHIHEALQAALADLAEGRLPLGAGMSKGHGYFKGELANETMERLWKGVAA